MFQEITNKILTRLNAQATAAEKKEIAEALQNRVNRIILGAFLERVGEKEAEDLKQALELGIEQAEKKFAEAAAACPGLWEEIEKRIEAELMGLEAI